MKNNGFTLMELMIVIAIIATLASIAIPNFLSWLPERRLDAGAQDILQGLQKSRSRAIMTNRSVIVNFNADSILAFVDDDDSGNQDAGELTIVNQTMPAGVNISADLGGSVTFNNRGFPSTSGTLTIQNTRGNSRDIELYLSGHSVLD